MQTQEEALQQHSRLNEKQRQIEQILTIDIDDLQVKLKCIQCGKEAIKVKCKECSEEYVRKRNVYTLFTSSWVVSSIVLFSVTKISTSLSGGFFCGSFVSNLYAIFSDF